MAMSRCSYCGSVQGATNSRGDWVCYACGKTTLANFSGKTGAADAITCNCPHCGTAFRVGASLQGKSVRCKKCGAGFVVSATPATSPSAADLPPTIAVSLPNRQAAGGSAGVPPVAPPSPAVSPGPVAAPGYNPAGGASLPPVMPPPPPIPTHSRDWRTIIAVAVGSGLALVALVAIIMTFILMRQPGHTEAEWLDPQQHSNSSPLREQKPAEGPVKAQPGPANPDASHEQKPAVDTPKPQPAPLKPDVEDNPEPRPDPAPNPPAAAPNAQPQVPAAAPATKPKEVKHLFEELAPSVPIVITSDGKRSSHGSGFLIQHGDRWYVATNRHVAENAAAGLELKFYDSKQRLLLEAARPQIEIERMSREADVALINCDALVAEFQAKNIRPLQLAPANYEPPQGEKVLAIGHPGAIGPTGAPEIFRLTVTEGIVSGFKELELEKSKMRFIITTASINRGNSGGPVLDFESRVLGINTLGHRQLSGLYFALDVRHLHDLLNKPETSYTPEEIKQRLKEIARRPMGGPAQVRIRPRVVHDTTLLLGPFNQQGLPVKLTEGDLLIVSVQPLTVYAVEVGVFSRNVRLSRGVQTVDNPRLVFQAQSDGNYSVGIFNQNIWAALLVVRVEVISAVLIPIDE